MLNNAFHAATGCRVSTQTVRNTQTPRHHAAWYRWTKQHAEWTHQNWHQVLFTDECRICLQPDNCRGRVWRQSGQAERLIHTIQRVQQGGGSLMFWSGIMWGRLTPMVVMEGAEMAI